jgi:tetratricopeptide (TPR) repeat protein
MLAFLAVVSGFAAFSYGEWQRAEEQQHRAEQEEQKALDQARRASEAERRALDAARRAKEAGRRADKARDAVRKYVLEAASELRQQSDSNLAFLPAYARFLEVNNQQLDNILKDENNGSGPLALRQIQAVTLADTADVLRRLKRNKGEVLRTCDRARNIADRLARQTTDVASLQSAILTYDRIAQTLLALGDLRTAQNDCDTALRITGLLDRTKGERAYLRAFVYQTRGDILRAQKQQPEALKAYLQSLQFTEEARRARGQDDPKPRWLASWLYLRIGDLHFDSGRLEQAKEPMSRPAPCALPSSRRTIRLRPGRAWPPAMKNWATSTRPSATWTRPGRLMRTTGAFAKP